jgi:hypothetical protein
LVTLNQPKAVIYVPVDIFETSRFAVRQMRQGGLLADSGTISLPPTYFFFCWSFAQFDAGQLKVVGIGAFGYLTLLAARPLAKSKLGHLATLLLCVR